MWFWRLLVSWAFQLGMLTWLFGCSAPISSDLVLNLGGPWEDWRANFKPFTQKPDRIVLLFCGPQHEVRSIKHQHAQGFSCIYFEYLCILASLIDLQKSWNWTNSSFKSFPVNEGHVNHQAENCSKPSKHLHHVRGCTVRIPRFCRFSPTATNPRCFMYGTFTNTWAPQKSSNVGKVANPIS